jgi:hypothetical protein
MGHGTGGAIAPPFPLFTIHKRLFTVLLGVGGGRAGGDDGGENDDCEESESDYQIVHERASGPNGPQNDHESIG